MNHPRVDPRVIRSSGGAILGRIEQPPRQRTAGIAATHPPDQGARMSTPMVVIRTYSNEFDAELARLELEAAGIPVQLLTDGLSGVHPHLQFARGIRLAVPEEESAAALELLDTPGDPA